MRSCLLACSSALVSAALVACGASGGAPALLTGWALLRSQVAVQVALPAEFGTPHVQALAVDGWEDGIFISRDGLHLFAVYVPADLLSFTIAGAPQSLAGTYLRGPTFGMDLVTNPVGSSAWLHGDILHATRPATNVPFSSWQLSAMATPVFSEGAVVAQAHVPDTGDWDLFAYTSNDQAPDYNPHVHLLHNAVHDPTNTGTILPAPVTTAYKEDNPHIERLDATHLVLMFDSDDRPGGIGLHDIWYATSSDDGTSWSAPALVASLCTTLEEEQPHLYLDAGGLWWLYYTATNAVDSKLGIFRARQTTIGDWATWNSSELVVGAGNAAGVGEPTLTAGGDLSFVVVYEDVAHGTPTNRFDADPWFLPRLSSSVVRGDAPRSSSPLALSVASSVAASVAICR